jgi:hypothetical protein
MSENEKQKMIFESVRISKPKNVLRTYSINQNLTNINNL